MRVRHQMFHFRSVSELKICLVFLVSNTCDRMRGSFRVRLDLKKASKVADGFYRCKLQLLRMIQGVVLRFYAGLGIHSTWKRGAFIHPRHRGVPWSGFQLEPDAFVRTFRG